MRMGITLQKGTATERLGGQGRRAGPMHAIHAARGLVRRLVPSATRNKSLLLQRLKLRDADYQELSQVVRLIESRKGR
jgi:hypothetical protein